MSFELNGKMFEILETQQVTDTFRKREFVVETVERNGEMEYREFVKFQLLQDKCELADSFSAGDEVSVHFNIKGRKWEKGGEVKYFTNLDAWRIEKINGGGESPDDIPPPDDFSFEGDESDDVPF